MKWKKLRRETGLVEHVCEHGIGHPNWGSAAWQAQFRQGDFDEGHETWLIHGCDGCCHRDDFPGTPERSLEFATKLLEVNLEHLITLDGTERDFIYAIHEYIAGLGRRAALLQKRRKLN